MDDLDHRLDELCQRTRSPFILNALHACRPGHPLGQDNHTKWRSAQAMIAQYARDFAGVDTRWIDAEAEAEWRRAIFSNPPPSA